MPKISLSDLVLRHLKLPDKGQTTYWDTVLPCFGVRVSQGGAKTFTVMHGKSRRRETIGKYPLISLSDARKAAKRILAKHTLDKHVPPSVPFSEALEGYFKHIEGANRPRTVQDYNRLINRHWKPSMRHSQLSDITPQDVHRKLDKLVKTPAERRYALVVLKAFFSWCEKRHYLERSPAANITLPKGKDRERVLTDDELKAVWNAATSYPFGSIVRLCILTGLRRGEAASLHWGDINETMIVIPPERTKNKREHFIPRTPQLDGVLSEVKKLHDTLLFPARGKDTPFNGWSKCRAALDTTITKHNDGQPLAPFVLHDLRRTFSTQLASLGTPPHILERLLNHKSGQISGVAAIYNRFQYFDECKAALEAWHEHLVHLLAR